MKNELISLIVPIYKVEDYLDECIESLVNQTYKNLEIILVDDGSPDKCPKICDEWQKKDDRIKVIHKENEGLPKARNSGMEIAHGDFLAFIDSDDLVLDTYIEHLYIDLKKYDADISVGNLIMFNDKIKKPNIINNQSIVIENDDIYKYSFEEKYFWILSHGRLFSRKVIQNIKFDPQMKISEDLKFFVEVLSNTKRVVVIPKNEYLYRLRDNSATRGKFYLDKWKCDFDYTEQLLKKYKHSQIKNSIIKRFINVNATCCLSYNLNKEEYEIIRTNIKKYKNDYLKFASIKQRIKIYLILYFYNLKFLWIKFKA